MREHSIKATIITAIALFAVTILSGCKSKISENEIVGNYEAHFPYGTEKLELHNDGTYLQTVIVNRDTVAKTNRGKWEFDEEYFDVTLYDALIVSTLFSPLDSIYRVPKPTREIFSAKKVSGKISLRIYWNSDLAYEKKN